MAPFTLLIDKVEQVLYLRIQMAVALQDLTRVFQSHLGTIDQSMRLGEARDLFRSESLAFQPNNIHTAYDRGVSFDEHVRRHVMHDAAHTTYETGISNCDPMVHAHVA